MTIYDDFKKMCEQIRWDPVYGTREAWLKTRRELEAMGLAPSLDYLVQYAVENVAVPKNGNAWAIVFNNGAVLTNLNEDIPAPNDLAGVVLMTAIHSKDSTRARFGLPVPETGEVLRETEIEWPLYQEGETDGDSPVVTKTYAISDPRFPADTEPDQPEVVAELVEGSREQEGPSEEWHAAEVQRLADEAREAARLSRHAFVPGGEDVDELECKFCGMLQDDEIHQTDQV